MESSEINKTALPPCHDNFQVIGVPLFDNEMIALAGKNGANISKQMKRRVNKNGYSRVVEELHWGQRTDTFLGFPFNIASSLH
jgi:thymidylate synthase